MKTISLDLRERILASYDSQEGTRQQIADRFRVSEGMVKKLLQQRRQTGDIGPRHRHSGRKPIIVGSHRRQLRAMLGQRADMTLVELRNAGHLREARMRIGVHSEGYQYRRLRAATALRMGTHRHGSSNLNSASKPSVGRFGYFIWPRFSLALSILRPLSAGQYCWMVCTSLAYRSLTVMSKVPPENPVAA